MTVWSQAKLAVDHEASGRSYLEFLREDSMSVGLYVLPAGGTDPQQPHNQDEIYVVVSGRGRVTIGGEVSDVEPGSVVFVPARVEHRFHDFAEELRLVVVFAPPETE
jgi:mannose-6-phosphate isomerase-like protein (cupin superfamily)